MCDINTVSFTGPESNIIIHILCLAWHCFFLMICWFTQRSYSQLTTQQAKGPGNSMRPRHRTSRGDILPYYIYRFRYQRVVSTDRLSILDKKPQTKLPQKFAFQLFTSQHLIRQTILQNWHVLQSNPFFEAYLFQTSTNLIHMSM